MAVQFSELKETVTSSEDNSLLADILVDTETGNVNIATVETTMSFDDLIAIGRRAKQLAQMFAKKDAAE